MKIPQVSPLRHDDDAALHRWARAKRAHEREQLDRELVVELRRLRAELHALRLTLERLAA